MSNTNTGGPAFPYEYFDHQLSRTRTMAGMTLRDYFAAKAITAFIFAGSDYDRAATEAYKQADAMLKARQA
jgi:hypothetical protein